MNDRYRRPQWPKGLWNKTKGEIEYNEEKELGQEQVCQKIYDIVKNHYRE